MRDLPDCWRPCAVVHPAGFHPENCVRFKHLNLILVYAKRVLHRALFIQRAATTNNNNKKKKSISDCFSCLHWTVAVLCCCTALLWIVCKKFNLPLKDLVSGVATELDRRKQEYSVARARLQKGREVDRGVDFKKSPG